MSEICSIITTLPNIQVARELALKIIDSNLAGCVNILPGIESFYHWEGKTQNDNECYLIAKTLEEKISTLSDFLKENHPYKVPFIGVLKIESKNLEYSNWLGIRSL